MSKGYNTTVYREEDYSKFKRLAGNREVTNRRVAIIKKSIEDIGYISNPIIVNEKMEVIDGQGRLEALRQLGMPVEYRIVPGTGINECRYMNLRPTAWSQKDYVKSYAELGDKNYFRLLELHETYGISIAALGGLLERPSGTQNGNTSTAIRSGDMQITDGQYRELIDFLEEYSHVKPAVHRIGGRTERFLTAIWWIWKYSKEADFERLEKQIIECEGQIHKFTTIEDTLKNLSEVYNRGLLRKNRFYWDTDYKKGLWREGSEDLSIQ